MALPDIRSLPVGRWKSYRFELLRVDYLTPVVGGRLSSVTAGWPLWVLEAQPSFKTEAQSEAWSAWYDSLRGAQKRFYAGPERRLPLSYAKGLPVGFNGAAATWSLNATRDILTLTGLPVGFRLRPGDLIGFRWGSAGRTCVKCMEDVVGATVSFAIEPALPSVVAGSAVAHVDDPLVLMKLDVSRSEVGPLTSNRTKAITIAAVQDLRA